MREELRARHEQDSSELKALDSARFVGDPMVIDITRRFIIENARAPMIILTGVPRNTEQVKVVLPFLKHTGFARRTLWFDTSREVCLGRPMRPDRDDDTPEKRLIRMADFEKLTLPIRRLLEMKTDFGSVDEHGGSIAEVRAEIERLSFVKNLMIEAS
jgi:adenylate kinase family enzyme